VIACETSGVVRANGSEDCAETLKAEATARDTKSRRMAEDRMWTLSDDLLMTTRPPLGYGVSLYELLFSTADREESFPFWISLCGGGAY
jgi:hypothetical protein